MRYLLVVLLLAGCSSPPAKILDAEAQKKRDEAIRKDCDFMVGPPRDSRDYLACMEMIAGGMK